MKAKVKDNYRWHNISALSGAEFVKGEWREVPAGFEEEAKRHPALEIQAEKVAVKATVQETVIEAPVQETATVETIQQPYKSSYKKRGE